MQINSLFQIIITITIILFLYGIYRRDIIILSVSLVNICIYLLFRYSVLYKFDRFSLDGILCKNNNYINLNGYL